MKNKIKLIILDAYGVVFMGGYPYTCEFIAKKFNKDWEKVYEIIYKKNFNKAAERKITQAEAWERTIKELSIPISVKEIKNIHYRFMRLNMKLIRLIKGVAGEIKVLLLSKNTRNQFFDVNKKLKFRKHFKYIINTWELNLPKASEKTIKYIIKKFKVKPEEIIYIDDQAENLVAAKKIGIKTIFYNDKYFKKFKKELKLLLE